MFVCYRNTCNVKNLHEGFNISFKSFLKIKKRCWFSFIDILDGIVCGAFELYFAILSEYWLETLLII